jgi:large subunit ribosomal protein L24
MAMSGMKVKKGDLVKVQTGKERGKQAKVLRILPGARTVVLEGLFMAHKHRRARRSGEKGQIVQIAMPVAASKVMVVCPQCSKPTRVGYRREGDKKVRLCKKCGASFS